MTGCGSGHRLHITSDIFIIKVVLGVFSLIVMGGGGGGGGETMAG